MSGSKQFILCAILALVFLVVGCSAYRKPDDFQGKGADNGMLDFGMVDGPGMERRWTEYALFSDWVEIANGSQWTPARLSFTPDRCTFSNEWTQTSFGYTIPEDAVNISSPKGEVYLELDDQSVFQGLIYHEEKLESGYRLPVLSGTAVELDGRGEVVLVEFVLETDMDKLPDEFYSSTYISKNCTDGIPTYIQEKSTSNKAPAEEKTITSKPFFAADANGENADTVLIENSAPEADSEDIDGGTIASHEAKAPINSQQISSFHGEFSVINYGGENDAPWLYILSACLENGVVKGSYQECFSDHSPDAIPFETAPSFFASMQAVVLKYDLTQYNGRYKQVEGLPEFYGDALQISYQSGESVYAFDNQDNILPYDAVMDIVKQFKEALNESDSAEQ